MLKCNVNYEILRGGNCGISKSLLLINVINGLMSYHGTRSAIKAGLAGSVTLCLSLALRLSTLGQDNEPK